jgi:hypothetical protein
VRIATEVPRRSGQPRRIGTDAHVAWIRDETSVTSEITAAVPPISDAYATVDLVDHWDEHEQQRYDRAVIALLSEHADGQPWWLGYLDTGADDIVFPDAPKVTLYAGWQYVLVEAGPLQAGTWRHSDASTFCKSALPNLIFPVDRGWLFSTLWDDGWSCIGGSAALLASLLDDPVLQSRARRVELGCDVTPSGRHSL